VEERRRHGEVAQRRRPELVAVGAVAVTCSRPKSSFCPGPSNAALVFFGATCGTPNTRLEKSLNISLDFPATAWQATHPALPKKKQGALLLVGRQGRALPPREAVQRRVGEGEANSNSAIASPNISKVIARPAAPPGRPARTVCR